jgi:hypothetical protein
VKREITSDFNHGKIRFVAMLVIQCSLNSNSSPRRNPGCCLRCYLQTRISIIVGTRRSMYTFHGCNRPSLAVKCCTGPTDEDNSKEGDHLKKRSDPPSRRDFVLNSVNLAILGAAISADGTTIVNSILGEERPSELPTFFSLGWLIHWLFKLSSTAEFYTCSLFCNPHFGKTWSAVWNCA